MNIVVLFDVVKVIAYVLEVGNSAVSVSVLSKADEDVVVVAQTLSFLIL